MNPPRTTLRLKLMKAIMGTSIAVLLLTCAAFIAYEVVAFRAGLLRGLQTRAQIIADNSTAALAFQNASDATEVLAALRRDRHMVAACLYDTTGRVFAAYPAGTAAAAFPAVRAQPWQRFGRTRCEVSEPVMLEGQRIGTIYLASDLGALAERYRLYALLVLAVLSGSIVLAFALSRWLERGISRPILQLADTARFVSEHRDYSVRAPRTGDDEIGFLTDAFNEMLQEIRELNADLERRVLTRTRELRVANEELEAFSSAVSHDLRGPLRRIATFSELLEEELGLGTTPAARDALQRIRAAVKHVDNLINVLLELSRLSQAKLQRQPVDLSAMAREIVAGLRQAHPERDVRVSVPDGLVVQGDPMLLRVVIENLLHNAWKFTSRHATAHIEFGCRNVDHGVHYFVHDDGAGFDPRHAENLFKPFQRLHSRDEFEGTGVGLTTVKRIVERHGGRLWAEGEVERGATFWFSLWDREPSDPRQGRLQSAGRVG